MNKLILCNNCGAEGDPKTKTCPKCGAKIKGKTGCLKMVAYGFGAFIFLNIILGIVGVFFSGTGKPSEKSIKKEAQNAVAQVVSKTEEAQSQLPQKVDSKSNSKYARSVPTDEITVRKLLENKKWVDWSFVLDEPDDLTQAAIIYDGHRRKLSSRHLNEENDYELMQYGNNFFIVEGTEISDPKKFMHDYDVYAEEIVELTDKTLVTRYYCVQYNNSPILFVNMYTTGGGKSEDFIPTTRSNDLLDKNIYTESEIARARLFDAALKKGIVLDANGKAFPYVRPKELNAN